MRRGLESRGCKSLQQCDQSVSRLQSPAKSVSSRAVGLQAPAGKPGIGVLGEQCSQTAQGGATPTASVLAGASLRVECKPLYRNVCANGMVKSLLVQPHNLGSRRVSSGLERRGRMRRNFGEAELKGRLKKQEAKAERAESYPWFLMEPDSFRDFVYFKGT